MEQWVNLILVFAGGIMLLWSMIYYFLDCLQTPYTSMGTDMSFSHYWFTGAVVLLLGMLPLLSLSRYWTGVSIIPLYLLSFPVRRLIKKLCRRTSDGSSAIK
jgi:hypothetical protein